MSEQLYRMTVFISYSHDSDQHRDRVLALSERLRQDGIETILDRYVNGSPAEGWPRWMMNALQTATHVLCVCTETYQRRFLGQEVPENGKGVDWESAMITQDLYDARSINNCFIPVIFAIGDEQYIPLQLRGNRYYLLNSEANYQALSDALLRQSGVEPGEVVELKRKPRAMGSTLRIDEESTVATSLSTLAIWQEKLEFLLAEEAISTDPSQTFRLEHLIIEAQQKVAEQGGRNVVQLVKARNFDLSRIDRYAPETLIGREAEIDLLNDTWQLAINNANVRPRIVSFIGLGGEGKTSLVAKWAVDLARSGWPGCEAAFAWSFYSQGTREQSVASSDAFINEALKFLGDADSAASVQSAVDKARRLASLLSARRCVLILDGIEPLQYAPTAPLAGELKDSGLLTLLKLLALNNAGLCVLTSRYALTDLQAYQGSSLYEHKLQQLSEQAGTALLRQLGVRGQPADYAQLVHTVKGHALTLNLLGRYLLEAHAGDIRLHTQVNLSYANEEQGGHAFHVMEAYVAWLQTGGKTAADQQRGQQALALLQLLGLFDRPASVDCIEALFSPPAIAELNAALIPLNPNQRNTLYTRLEKSQLLTINRDAASQLLSLDTHPLIREYFAQRLKTQHPEAWQAGHERIYRHLCEHTQEGEQPSLADLQPLYQAVVHGCQVGRQQEVCEEVYFKRILRKDEHYSTKKLGAFGADLGAVACFFDQPWSTVHAGLSEVWQSWLLNAAAFRLRALGRLHEALQPMAAGLKMYVVQENWKQAAISASNLSELALTLGQLQGETGALEYAALAVLYADKSGDAFWRMVCRTAHADALHQAGEQAAALVLFQQAEQMQADRQPDYPLLYSLPGFRYCERLLNCAERAAWLSLLGAGQEGAEAVQHCDSVAQRAAQTLAIAKQNNMPLLDIALNHLTLGRCQLYQALLNFNTPNTAAIVTLNAAVDGLRRAGIQDHLPRSLLTRAWALALNPGTHAQAIADLNEAWDIAERGSMPLHQADIHLYRARLFGKQAVYPWDIHLDGTTRSPLHDLKKARRLIEKHGYWRRKQELEDAETANVQVKANDVLTFCYLSTVDRLFRVDALRSVANIAKELGSFDAVTILNGKQTLQNRYPDIRPNSLWMSWMLSKYKVELQQLCTELSNKAPSLTSELSS